jgi:multicomponent Na+:H+ antiporter subunit D
MNVLPALPAVAPLLAAALIGILGAHLPRRLADTVALAASLCAAVSSFWLMRASAHQVIVYWFGGWHPRGSVALGIAFQIDPLGAGAAAMAASLVLASFVFSLRYFDSVGNTFQILMLLFEGAMCAFALTGDLFNLFVWFELMSASAFALCGYKTEESGPVQGALNFAVTNTIGAFMVLTGIALLYGRTGALNMAQIGRSLGSTHDSLVVVAFTFMACGFLVKAGMVPFHWWLDDAHAVAPTPVCVLLSGIMVELGLLAVARVYWTIFREPFSAHDGSLRGVFIAFGTLTAIVGALMCYSQRHIKRLLAFSTISHMGLMIIAFGLLSRRALGGLSVYVVGHGALKAALFMAAGVVLRKFDTVDEFKLLGQGKRLLGGSAMGLLLAIGLSGVPPYGTWMGEGIIDHAAEEVGYSWISYVFMFGGIVTAAAVLRVTGRFQVGWGRVEHEEAGVEQGETDEGPESAEHEIFTTMAVPIYIFLFLGVAITFLPHLRDAVSRAAMHFIDTSALHSQALDAAALPAYSPEPKLPLLPGIIRGLVATMLAVLLAVATLFWEDVPVFGGLDVKKVALTVVRPLRVLHSGAIGDYVTWITFGTAVIGVAFAWLLR